MRRETAKAAADVIFRSASQPEQPVVWPFGFGTDEKAPAEEPVEAPPDTGDWLFGTDEKAPVPEAENLDTAAEPILSTESPEEIAYISRLVSEYGSRAIDVYQANRKGAVSDEAIAQGVAAAVLQNRKSGTDA